MFYLLFKIAPCAFSVMLYLSGKPLGASEFPLRPEETEQFYPDGRAIKISREIKQIALNADMIFIAYSGSYADIGNGQIFRSVSQISLCGINSVFRNNNALRNAHIYCGRADLRTEMISATHSIRQGVRSAQIFIGFFNVAALYELADNRRADNAPVTADSWDYIASNTEFFAMSLKPVSYTHLTLPTNSLV